VLRRLLEPDQFTSIRYGERLAELGATPSIGSIGDSFDSAMAESQFSLYKDELVSADNPAGTNITVGSPTNLDPFRSLVTDLIVICCDQPPRGRHYRNDSM
jgi:transposase InsO family protein